MNRDDFADALDARLRRGGVPFRRSDLEAFAADAWSRMEAEPDVGAWAGRFAAAQRAHARAAAGRSACVSLAAQAAVLAAAFWCGCRSDPPAAMSVAPLASPSGLALMAAGAIWRRMKADIRGWRDHVPMALVGYAVVLGVVEASELSKYSWGAAIFVCLLVPFVAGGVVFFREREWLAVAGVYLFLFASSYAAAYDATHTGSGVGYWSLWLA
jgi:hypothetical protein